MLAMNKLVEDVAEFIKKRESEKSVVIKTEEMLMDEVVLFAHDLSEKHNEHVSVELVVNLMTSYQDSIDKKKNDDLLDNIDDGIDLNEGD